MVGEFENCILITMKISTIQDLIPVLEKNRPLRSPLLIIAEDVDGSPQPRS